ncbi:MAG: SIMPL domain-containing protein [Pseudomonadales bacterium]|nr:SIMPL domain-containing protein [Pseudomonadales bacterium]
MKFRHFAAVALAAHFLAGPASAQNQYDLSGLEPGQLLLNLSASEQISVAQDTLNATVEYSAQGRDKLALQNEVNTFIKKALDILDQSEEIEFSTQQYQVYIRPSDRPRELANPVWQAQQSLRLISTNSAGLLDAIARLQEAGLHVTSLYYTLSSEKYEETADSLMKAALEKLQARASEVATLLNKGSALLVEVTLDGGNQPFFGGRVDFAMRATAMDNETIETPSAVPGETQVSLNVSARALLSP